MAERRSEFNAEIKRIVDGVAPEPAPTHRTMIAGDAAALNAGLDDYAAGRVKPLEQIERELAAEPAPTSMTLAEEPCPDCGSQRHKSCRRAEPAPTCLCGSSWSAPACPVPGHEDARKAHVAAAKAKAAEPAPTPTTPAEKFVAAVDKLFPYKSKAEPAVERPTEPPGGLITWKDLAISNGEILKSAIARFDEAESELSSLRAELHAAEMHALDRRAEVEELKTALRTYGRHKDTWKCMTGERACASISGGKCDCGFEKALGTAEGNRG